MVKDGGNGWNAMNPSVCNRSDSERAARPRRALPAVRWCAIVLIVGGWFSSIFAKRLQHSA